MDYANKDEVILNNELFMKYFSCLALENYEKKLKKFKQTTKALHNFHSDLMLIKNENEDEDETQKDFTKAIENKNLILLTIENKNK